MGSRRLARMTELNHDGVNLAFSGSKKSDLILAMNDGKGHYRADDKRGIVPSDRIPGS